MIAAVGAGHRQPPAAFSLGGSRANADGRSSADPDRNLGAPRRVRLPARAARAGCQREAAARRRSRQRARRSPPAYRALEHGDRRARRPAASFPRRASRPRPRPERGRPALDVGRVRPRDGDRLLRPGPPDRRPDGRRDRGAPGRHLDHAGAVRQLRPDVRGVRVHRGAGSGHVLPGAGAAHHARFGRGGDRGGPGGGDAHVRRLHPRCRGRDGSRALARQAAAGRVAGRPRRAAR